TLESEIKKTPRMIHIEWGADSHAGRHSEDVDRLVLQAISNQANETEREMLFACGQTNAPQNGDWSETYACHLFDWHLKEQDGISKFAGSAQWAFKDFSTPLRPSNPIPRVNQKGLVQRDLTVKEGYFVFQSYWADKPMVHIYGHSWPIRWGNEDEDKLV